MLPVYLFRNKIYVFSSLSSVFFLFGIIGRTASDVTALVSVE